MVVVWASGRAHAGPYAQRGVSGFVNPFDRRQWAGPQDANAVLNPIFRGWARGYVDYLPADTEWVGSDVWNDPDRAVGLVTGDRFDIVSLGDLDGTEIAAGAEPGRITLIFGDPARPGDPNHIRNGAGYDFAVFENGLISAYNTSAGSASGQMLAELAYVEVSSNGIDFARFPCVSLTEAPVGPYGTIDVSDVHNLAGKHANGNSICTGTPFDLADLREHTLVTSGAVDLNDICYVRIVDVPGSGDFTDEAVAYIDPATWPDWDYYAQNRAVYDAWVTWGSGGFDLEAVGVLHPQQYSADIDLNGIVDAFDFAVLAGAWDSHFGRDGWAQRCDLAGADLTVDVLDVAQFAAQWLAKEAWAGQ